MIDHVPSRSAWGVSLAAALLGLACLGSTPPRGVPLYANASGTPPPRATVAQLIGPIGKVDGRDVVDQGGVFELMPGCHVVELDRRPLNTDNYSVTGSVYVSGEFPLITYAIRMKAGASYIIRRHLPSDGTGQMVQLQLSAQEEDATGRVTNLNPMKSTAEIQECNQ